VNDAPTTTQTTTPEPSIPGVPPNTAAAAAPINAKYACEYLTRAVSQLSSNDHSVDQAVALVQSGIDSALAASVDARTYTKLRTNAEAFLDEVVRLQIQRQISGRTEDVSRYPASYRDADKAVAADCS
jgi:hypothetical protein